MLGGPGRAGGAPDLAVRCSRGQGSALAVGRLESWKQKWAKSDSNIFSEPVKKYYRDGKINIMTKSFNRLLKMPTHPINAYLTSPSGWMTRQNKCFKTLFSCHVGRPARVTCETRRHTGLLDTVQWGPSRYQPLSRSWDRARAAPGARFPSLVTIHHTCKG